MRLQLILFYLSVSKAIDSEHQNLLDSTSFLATSTYYNSDCSGTSSQIGLRLNGCCWRVISIISSERSLGYHRWLMSGSTRYIVHRVNPVIDAVAGWPYSARRSSRTYMSLMDMTRPLWWWEATSWILGLYRSDDECLSSTRLVLILYYHRVTILIVWSDG